MHLKISGGSSCKGVLPEPLHSFKVPLILNDCFIFFLGKATIAGLFLHITNQMTVQPQSNPSHGSTPNIYHHICKLYPGTLVYSLWKANYLVELLLVRFPQLETRRCSHSLEQKWLPESLPEVSPEDKHSSTLPPKKCNMLTKYFHIILNGLNHRKEK